VAGLGRRPADRGDHLPESHPARVPGRDQRRGYGEISILCSGTPYLGTYDYSSGGKVTGCPADLLGSELAGRYRDDNARVLSQEGNFVITGKPGSPRRFDGSFTPAGQGQSQPWSGIYLGQ